MMDDRNILKKVKGQTILVAGDLMLDAFIYGDVDRISPEGPVPILSITGQTTMLGGVGNVISNLYALGCVPLPFSMVGADDGAKKVFKILEGMNLKIDGVICDPSRPTTLKTRYVARTQQLLRSDVEKTHSLSSDLEQQIIDKITITIKNVSGIILSDYGKGFLTPTLISSIVAVAKKHKIPVLVDPKGVDYNLYRGADFITPNRKELALASGFSVIKTDDDVENASLKVISECGIGCVVATRSEDGLSVIQKNVTPTHIPTNVQQVFDVSGAGDTVIATLAAMISSGADIETSAKMANMAASIAVSKLGTTAVTYQELDTALSNIQGDGHQAIVAKSFEDAAAIVKAWQESGQKVGLTNGCFDILHAGHVRYINQARGMCDRLVLALNHDNSVRILKGPTRPVNDQDARAAVIGGLGAVDLVVFFGAQKAGEDNTPCALVDALHPDIFFKGGDYTIDQLPEGKIVQSYGGEVAIMAMHGGFSTTAIIKKTSGQI